MKRRDLLRAGVALPSLAAAGSISETEAWRHRKRRHKRKHKHKHNGGQKRNFKGMNVLVFITDQQRKTMHFPKGWEEENLPGLTRLKQHGLSFENAFCSSCMCSPSRATLFTGYFPAQHGVKYTLEEVDNPPPTFLQSPLPLPDELPNLATALRQAGYHAPYKGKWHLSLPTSGDEWQPVDVNQYGFERWDPPDAGANQDIDQFGGGKVNNDGRFVEDDGPVQEGQEGALEYLKSSAAKQQPFFMVVSLVNPHDVLAYPGTGFGSEPPPTYIEGGYNPTDLKGDIRLPKTAHEDLSTKPSAQQEFLNLTNFGLGPLPTDAQKENYLNFYGNLIKESDEYLEDILDTLEDEKLLGNTLIIYMSDHGEMGMTHGGQRQKMFNFYEETLRVPLVYSNPRLFKQAYTSTALVSHVDFVPTVTSLLGVPKSARQDWQGVDYSRLVREASSANVQDYVVFTFDDIQAGQPNPPYVQPPNHITSIRETRYKLARYYDADGNGPEQWEMYDLRVDPLETLNIAAPDFPRTERQQAELDRLKAKLAEVEQTRLQPL